MTTTNQQSIARYQQMIEEGLGKLALHKEPSSLYEPIRYTLQHGGKRMRPLLAILACEMAGGSATDALKPALGIELFHNFTLLHDDIMDKAPLRRGKATVFQAHGLNTAILSGDVMLVEAYELIATAPSNLLPGVLNAFNRTAVEVCEGQQLDLEYEGKPAVSISEYLEMIGLKTAALLGGSMEIGAILGGSSEAEAESYHEIGWQMGIAFQLQDDLLDTYGDPSKFGKQVGGDIIQNKKTFLLLKALELASKTQRQTLEHWLSWNEADLQKKVAAVTSVFDELDIRKQTEEERDKHYEKALGLLNTLDAEPQPKESFLSFANQLLKREQ